MMTAKIKPNHKMCATKPKPPKSSNKMMAMTSNMGNSPDLELKIVGENLRSVSFPLPRRVNVKQGCELARWLWQVASNFRVDADIVQWADDNGAGDRTRASAGRVVALQVPALDSGGNAD